MKFTKLELDVLETTVHRLLDATDHDDEGEYDCLLRKGEKPALARAWFKLAKETGKA